MGQKVLVIGSGAREHTIAYTLLKAPSIDEVTVAPGNPGMLKDGIHTTQLSQSNHAALIEFVKNNGYDWVFVGPEVPLIEGIVDDFAAAGIEDVVERAFQQFAGFLGPAFDHAHGLGVKVLRHQLSKELGRIR